MKWFRADLHIHTVLSPCGDLSMSPERIVDEALKKGLDVIAITDHNSTLQCAEVMEVGREKGLLVIGGAEVNTREEVHCVSLFENQYQLQRFQLYLDKSLPLFTNDPDKFGHQVWVNRREEILGEETRLLWSALYSSIDQVAEKVADLDGIFFPAHIDRPVNGLIRQLGWIPKDLMADAVEVLYPDQINHEQLKEIRKRFSIIMNSDAHSPEQIGRRYSWLKMSELTFREIKMALHGEAGRSVQPERD